MRRESTSKSTARWLAYRLYRSRVAVTLLELMVALGLLSMLLLVAWSLFDNLQKAEERSAGLANRVQVLRQIRSWLAEDIDQFELPSFSLGQNNTPNNEAYFIGDATGFVATLTPSLDPLPFLQDAFASSSQTDAIEGMPDRETELDVVSVYDTDQDRQVRAARRSPWPTEKLNVEYRLLPDDSLSKRSISNPFEESSFQMVRRERMRTAAGSVPSQTSSSADSTPAADRQLTIRDLYRQEDETLDTLGSIIRQKALVGLRNASFQYFDGSSWQGDWDSRKQNAFPLAIAIQFDFPSRSQQRKELLQRKRELQQETTEDLIMRDSFSTIDTLLSQQSTARTESGDNQEYLIATSSNEVTIVVATHFRAPNPLGESTNSQSNTTSRFMNDSSRRQRP